MSIAPQPSPERIFGAMNAYQLTVALKSAIDLDLFTAVGEGATTAARLAERCQASERGCRILCDFLTVHGLLTKSGGEWSLGPDAAMFLDRRSPACMGGIANFINSAELTGLFGDITGKVRKGESNADEGTVSPNNPIWVEFARSMVPMVSGATQDIADLVGGGTPLKVLDVAAGHGLFGIEIARRNPKADIVALDWAAVLEVARENAEQAGVAGRHRGLAGSAFEVDFGTGYDLVLLTNFLHHFDRSTCLGLLKKVRTCLKDGGRAVTLEFVPNEDRVSPPMHATFAFMMLGSTRAGDAYTFRELEGMFAEAGFRSSEMRDLTRSPQRLIVSTR